MTDETNPNRGWYVDCDGDLQFANPGHKTDGDFITSSGRAYFYGRESFDALVALVRAAGSAPTTPAAVLRSLHADFTAEAARNEATRCDGTQVNAAWLQGEAAAWSRAAEMVQEAIDGGANAPADDLPPGVERISDGTYICRGIDIPEGWGFYGPAESISASEDESRPWWDWRDRETDVRTGNVYYQVRPVTPAEPATEWVPVLDAIKNGRVLIAPDGSLMETKGHEVLVYLGRSGRWRCMYDDAGHAEAKRPHADADGKVEVQR